MGNRRRKDRLKLDKTLTSLCGVDGAPGRAVDISANGVQIETRRPLPHGQRLQVLFGRGSVLESFDGLWAVVMWQEGGRAGLCFLESEKAERRFGNVFRRWIDSSEPKTILDWVDELFAAR